MRRVGVELLVLVLREIIRLDVVPQLQRALGERLDAGQQLDQRRFACAVHTHQRDAIAALDGEVHVAKNFLLAP